MTVIEPSPLKAAVDKGSTIILILVLQEVSEVENYMTQAAEIVISMVITKSNVLTTRTTLVKRSSNSPPLQ